MVENLAIIKLVDVSKAYPRSGYILKSVNLTINQGDFVIIRGRSGMGKSTLLRMLGLLDVPTSGIISINGLDASKMNDSKLSDLRLRTIGFVFQQFNLIPSLTNLENIEIPMEIAKVERKERIKRAESLLEVFGLSKYATEYPEKISVGEQQRIAIARALANNPKVILADEPTASVDDKNSDLILGLLKNVNKENRVAVVLTTTSLTERYDSTSDLMISNSNVLEFQS